MSLVDDIGPDGGGDDIVAAEYVLGVLPADERRQAAQRIEAERAFARLVDRWEVHFAPLGVGYAEAEAPAGVKIALDRRLFSAGATTTGEASAPGLLSSLTFWRVLAVASLAALAFYIALPFLTPRVEAPQERLVASLAVAGSSQLARALSFRPLVAVGLVSYGIYLFHYPVVRAFPKEADPLVVGATATVLSIAIAALSYRLLETPIRRLKRKRPAADAAGRTLTETAV